MIGSELDAAGVHDPALREAYRRCRTINAEHGRTFFLATRLLAPEQRPAVHALYGFARRADDILDDFDEIKVGIAYILPDGTRVDNSFPASAEELEKVQVEYVTLPGWKSNTMGTMKYEELPPNAQAYIRFIEQGLGGVPVKYIGTGPSRDHMIVRD